MQVDVNCSGERYFQVKIETDSNDVTEHPRDNKSRPYLCTVCDKRFRTKGRLTRETEKYTTEKSCIDAVIVKNVLLLVAA